MGAKDCKNQPFLRRCTLAEEREARNGEQQKKQAEYFARKAEQKQKYEEYLERTKKREERKERNKWECESSCTESTAFTSSSATEINEAEVERLASMDTTVRKLTKTLQQISKLEGLRELDTLQVAKVARRREVEIELDTALGLAKARARCEMCRGSTA